MKDLQMSWGLLVGFYDVHDCSNSSNYRDPNTSSDHDTNGDSDLNILNIVVKILDKRFHQVLENK